MSRNAFVPTENVSTWDKITSRLRDFVPSIELADYIDFSAKQPVKVHGYVSEGINFYVSKKKRKQLVDVLRAARTHRGQQAFLGGRWRGALHAAKGVLRDVASGVTGKNDKESWANNASFLATKGDGFREIWYLDLPGDLTLPERNLRLQNLRPPGMKTVKLDPKFSAMFKARNASLDTSSLHFAVGDLNPKTGCAQCNVHIDLAGIIAQLWGSPSLTPDTPYHTLVELAFRTGLKGVVPDLLLHRLDFVMPNSSENYAFRFGAQANIIDRKNLRLSVRGLCSFSGPCKERSFTVTLSGRHDLFGGKGRRR